MTSNVSVRRKEQQRYQLQFYPKTSKKYRKNLTRFILLKNGRLKNLTEGCFDVIERSEMNSNFLEELR